MSYTRAVGTGAACGHGRTTFSLNLVFFFYEVKGHAGLLSYGTGYTGLESTYIHTYIRGEILGYQARRHNLAIILFSLLGPSVRALL